MKNVLQRLKRCEMMQWAIAYLAAAWVVVQVLAFTADGYGWPRVAMHIAVGVIALGFVVALVLAWYHGERGVQRVTGVERLLITLVLVVGAVLMWQFLHARAPAFQRVPLERVQVHARLFENTAKGAPGPLLSQAVPGPNRAPAQRATYPPDRQIAMLEP